MVRWIKFLLRRLTALACVLAGLLVATFLMVRLIPGDPALLVAGIGATDTQLTAIRQELGLTTPIGDQFVTYVTNVFHGNLGTSFQTREPVSALIGRRFGPSLQLAGLSLAAIFLIAIPGGILAAALTRDNRNRGAELAFTGVTSFLGAIPEFLFATFLVIVFAVYLRLLPVAGNVGWQSLVLPVAAIAVRPTMTLMRIVRVETLNVLAQDYIRTARSKRLPEALIYARHCLPNVLTAALAIGGLLFAGLIGGAIVVENVFARNSGLGTALTDAMLARDYPVVQGIVLLLGVIVVTVNIVIDIVIAMLDPRSLSSEV